MIKNEKKFLDLVAKQPQNQRLSVRKISQNLSACQK